MKTTKFARAITVLSLSLLSFQIQDGNAALPNPTDVQAALQSEEGPLTTTTTPDGQELFVVIPTAEYYTPPKGQSITSITKDSTDEFNKRAYAHAEDGRTLAKVDRVLNLNGADKALLGNGIRTQASNSIVTLQKTQQETMLDPKTKKKSTISTLFFIHISRSDINKKVALESISKDMESLSFKIMSGKTYLAIQTTGNPQPFLFPLDVTMDTKQTEDNS